MKMSILILNLHREMKATHKILIPNMAPIHFER